MKYSHFFTFPNGASEPLERALKTKPIAGKLFRWRELGLDRCGAGRKATCLPGWPDVISENHYNDPENHLSLWPVI
jgi:hypothetical protein